MAKINKQKSCRGLSESDVLLLREKGLTGLCISSLNRAVHAIAPYLNKKPTTTAVRTPLQKLDDLLHQAQQVMIGMERGEDPALAEARRHLGLAEASMAEPAPLADFDRSPAWFKESLDRCRSVVGAALDLAPLEQRHQVAYAAPARLVAEALEAHGFSKLAKGESFIEVVGICFRAAAGVENVSVDRSIRAYSAKRKDHDWLDEFCREWARMANNKYPG